MIKKLYETWPTDDTVDLFTINVPLGPELREDTKIQYTHILPNKWGPAFEYVEDPVSEREDGTLVEQTERIEPAVEEGRLKFKWMPNLKAVLDEIDEEPIGNDGWAITQGFVRYVCSSSLCRACLRSLLTFH